MFPIFLRKKKLYGIFGLLLLLLISSTLSGKGLSLKEFEKRFGPLPKEVTHPPFFEENPIDPFRVIGRIIFPFSYREGMHITAYPKTCFANQRVTQLVIEEYILDHPNGIPNFQDSFITTDEGLLVKSKCLKCKITPNDKRCKYHLFGDSRDQSTFFIYCSYHGAANKIDGLPEYKRRVEPLKLSAIIFITIILLGLVFYFVAKKKRKSS